MFSVQEQAEKDESNRKKEVVVPKSDYKEKYQHLIGSVAAKDAAKITAANAAYGFGM